MPSTGSTRPAQAAFATIRTGDEPGIRYAPGLTIYDKALVAGHGIGRYWSATGIIRSEKDIVPGLVLPLDSPRPSELLIFEEVA